MPRCPKCNYVTDKQFNLDRHMRVHDGKQPSRYVGRGTTVKSYKCQLCREFVSGRGDLISHFASDHDVVISKENLSFESHADFVNWKDQVEKDTASRYVKHNGIEQRKTYKSIIYYCHRDGYFSSSGSGKRQLKVLGSNKIDGCCPARIAAKLYDNGTVTVEFVDTHIGHTNDLGRVHMTKSERQVIAAEIAAGVAFKDILKGVRNSHHNSSANLLTRKDLWNIQQEFKLNNTAVRHQNDYISVHSWVKNNEDEMVRFYKQQGELLASHPELSSDDFILIIANESQLRMLEQFGGDCICLDGTRGLNQQDVELTTVMVLDELRQGFPCAFMLSSRTDFSIMKIFFSVITAELGTPFIPKVFMSDVAEAYRNAWFEVMPPPAYVLFCPWHVDSAWKANLYKVKDDLKKADVYTTLKALIEETEKTAFERLLAAAVFSFESDPDKREFWKYFTSEYGANTRSWAFCYRSHLGLNTNTNLEDLHKTIERCYFEGKKVKRLDKCITALMKVIRDELLNRGTACHRGKLSKKVSDTRRQHKAALEMTNVRLMKTELGCNMSSSSGSSHEIVLWNAECSCNLRCDDCGICVHTYKCDCLDASVKWVICRHVHFMVMKMSSSSSSSSPSVEPDQTDTPSQSSEDDLAVDNQFGGDVQDVKELRQTQDASALFEEEKSTLLENIRTMVESTRNLDELKTIKKAVLPVMPAIEAARSASSAFAPKEQVSNLNSMPPL